MLGRKVKMVKNGAQPFEDLRPCSAGWEEMIGRGTPESRRPPLSCSLLPWAKATAQPLRDIQGQPGWEPGSGQGSVLLAPGVMAQDQPGGSRPGPSCGLSGWWVGPEKQPRLSSDQVPCDQEDTAGSAFPGGGALSASCCFPDLCFPSFAGTSGWGQHTSVS